MFFSYQCHIGLSVVFAKINLLPIYNIHGDGFHISIDKDKAMVSSLCTIAYFIDI